jgi:hypothetical protein
MRYKLAKDHNYDLYAIPVTKEEEFQNLIHERCYNHDINNRIEDPKIPDWAIFVGYDDDCYALSFTDPKIAKES